MQCPRCQHGNPDDVKFCGECGDRLDATGLACRAANPPTTKLCHPWAQDHLRIATTMYREMDMRFWREQADAALGELR